MKKTTGITKEKAVRAAFAAVFVLLAVLCVFAGAGAGADNEQVVTITTDKESYFLTEDITFSGTNSVDGTLYFYVEGLNTPFTMIKKENQEPITVSGKNWTALISYDYLKKSAGQYLDAGRYTFYVSPVENGDKDMVTSGVHATAVVELTLCWISITSIDSIVLQGDDVVVKGRADAAKSVIWYLCGTNYFSAGVQGVTNNEFTITIDRQYMPSDAGQYFLIVQHPMYDGIYNAAPDNMDGMSSGEVKMRGDIQYILESAVPGVYNSGTTLSKAAGYDTATKLIRIDERLPVNLADGICEILENQNIDDMYSKSSIIVYGSPISTLNPISQKIIKGENLVISGATVGHTGDNVTVEITPVGAVESNAPVSLTTTVNDDGRWSISFDTSNLSVTDYVLSATVEGDSEHSENFTLINGTAGAERYEMRDAETISGGPLTLYEKETITPVTTNQYNEQSSPAGGSSTWMTGENGTQFKPGDHVVATLKLCVEGNCLRTGDVVHFNSDLVNPIWTVNVNNYYYSGETISTHHLTTINPVLSGFDINYFQANTVLDITVNGYIPAGDNRELSVIKVLTTSTSGNGYNSYNVPVKDPTPSGELLLQKGWNFISTPKKLSAKNDTAGELFAGVNTGGKSILSYNAQTKQWTTVTPSTVISPLNAYWIYSTEKHVLKPIFDTTPSAPAVKNVYTGWNAVGASAENPIAAKSAFTGVNWRTFLLWDAGSQKTSTIYDKDGSGAYSDEQNIPLYKGGWLYMNENGTLAAKTA